ncbi:unnamed protein product [Mytilus coruscus]|uniref:TRIM2_3 n=1 Tax=Mytilus coruscus TaxID=42192 RepID=A0A6J8CWU5_MYTCO|nr:unnamed protein product [Mytilus coruscus]
MIKLEQNVRDIQQNIEIFLQNRNSYLSNLQKQREDCIEKVKELRLKIDRHLDKLEKTVNDEIDTTYTNHKSEVEHTVDDLSGRKIKMDTFQNDIEKIKDHASDIQTFLSIQDIQKDVTEEKNHLVLIGQDRLQEIELSFTSASSCVSGIILESLGKLKTNIKPSDISFVRKDDSEAQLILPESNEKDINLISLAKRLDFTLPTNLGKAKFERCFCMDNGLILLADRGQKFRIIVFASNGALVCEIPLQQNPNDVVYINQSIYVSSFSSMTLTSIDFKTKQMKKRIDTSYKCDALAVAGDKILLRLSKFEYKIYDQNLVEVGKIPLLTTHAPHVCYFEERIYISLWKENKVNCYNMTGNLIWQFQHEYIRGLYGTAIDNYGNLFVCGFYSNSISVISPNGKNCRNLLNLTDVLAHPTSIYYNHVSKQLIVSSNECNKILVYGVS